MRIVWSEKAGETFQKNIDYVREHWTERETQKFINRVFQYLETLESSPFIGRKTNRTKHTYIGLIIPHISVVYRTKPGSDAIELVTFIDNRRSLKKNRKYL